MILTTCAACAAPLAHDAPRCVRCWTRYCDATYEDDSATIDDLHKSVKALEDLARTARRVLGGAHPFVLGIEGDLLPAWLSENPSLADDQIQEDPSTANE